ncbi:MAG: hypothetical protein K0S68_884 [Candidatus Saccharibacteria bacterium]|nr:hypothetical protein [Candidatus Saccharibacteria bacterium]
MRTVIYGFTMKRYQSSSLQFQPEWSVPAFDVTEFRDKQTKYAIAVFLINEGEKIKQQQR